MKKLLLATALFGLAGLTLYSCNNGAYDANPDSDLSAALNPLDPDSGSVNIYLGSMETVLNNKKLVFAPAFYFIDTFGVYNLIARVKDDSIFHRTLRISFTSYQGVKDYNVTADTVNPQVNFVMLDTSRVDKAGRKIYKTYTANTNKSVGYASFNVVGDEGGNFRGNFYGRLHRVLPEEQFEDTATFEFGPFYFKQVPFPVPAEYIEFLHN